ncbi:metal ABC transporter permease [Corynebacterium sp. 335C]
MSFSVQVAILAAVTAVTCTIPGIILVLRRQSMLTDAIGHAVLPGIVIAAMILGSVDSPLLLVGATVGGLVVVAASQWLADTGKFMGDAATGLVFPPLFALGVVLISTNFQSSHLSEHSVLVGDLNLTAMNVLEFGGYEFGPTYAWTMGAVGLLAAICWAVMHRQVEAATFDLDFARSTGVRVRLVNQMIMVLVSLTVVTAFHVAGSVLVVALMIVPPATAMLFCRTVPAMVLTSLAIALVSSQLGFWTAYPLGAATSPMMALVDGLIFLLAFGAYVVRQRMTRGTSR